MGVCFDRGYGRIEKVQEITRRMDYQVSLEVFHGPLDLLLYLVKRDELDLLDIPIARLAEQFLEYLNVLQVIDVEQAGDFLVMAATLMDLKSKMLLPHGEEEGGEEDDPRQELVRQLIEYKRFKDAALLLDHHAEQQSRRLTRQPPPPSTPTGPAPLRPVELWDLVSAFGRLLRETLTNQPQQIIDDQTPMQVYMDDIINRLTQAQRLPFSGLFTAPYNRSRLVGFFLAILELARRFRIQAEQDEVFGEVWVSLAAESSSATENPPTPSPPGEETPDNC